MLQDWQNSSTPDPDALLVVRQLDALDTRLAAERDSVVPVVPFGVLWEGAGHGPDQVLVVGHFDLGADKDVFAKHELRIQGLHALILGEREPHSPHERVCISRTIIEHGVNVVDKIVTHVDSIMNHALNTIVLNPWLSVLIVDFVVGPEEWIKHT